MKLKKSLTFLLSIVVALTSGTVLSSNAEVSNQNDNAQGQTNQTVPVTTGSGKLERYTQTFTEDWQGGLDPLKWETVKYSQDHIADFEVVDDPTGATVSGGAGDGEINKVLTFKRRNTLLIPSDDYWPTSGIAAGTMSVLDFRMKLDNLDFDAANRNSQGGLPGLAISSSGELKNSVSLWFLSSYQTIPIFHIGTTSFNDGAATTHGFDAWYDCPKREPYPFAYDQWFNVRITFVLNKIYITATDNAGKVYSAQRTVTLTDAKYAIGSRLSDWWSANANDENDNGVVYIDDIKITFKQSTKDSDDVQKDVNVYYAGNTFYEPGDTLSITGEKLGATVATAKIKKIDDTALDADLSKAIGIKEQDYFTAVDTNVDWDSIKSVEGSEIDLPIVQGTDYGVNLNIPDGSGTQPGCYSDRGMYAILLEAADSDGADGIVIVNNPQIRQLLHNDGDYATPGGWIKMIGNNLSVQNSVDKVSAIIIDSNGNRTSVNNSNISVDTTQNNNGRDNDYYMMINIPDNLAAGNYSIITHNGYGGNYGWSIPESFTVKNSAENAEWRKLGLFDVTDYGAVGDGLHNDTAAIAAALAAADVNGGGTVYLPSVDTKNKDNKGFYRVNTTLYVPQNVSLVGDSSAETVLYYDEQGNYCRYENFILFEKNFEISNINIYGSGIKRIFNRSYSRINDPGKVYIRNVYVMIDAFRRTSAGINDFYLQGYTQADAKLWVQANYPSISCFTDNHYSETYIEFNNVDFVIKNFGTLGYSIGASSMYSYQSDLNFGGYSSYNNIAGRNIRLSENCNFGVPALGTKGMYRNCTFKDNTDNNRELLLTDGEPILPSAQIQPILSSYTKDDLAVVMESELNNFNTEEKKQNLINTVSSYVNLQQENCVFRILEGSVSSRCYVYVNSGQGSGQVRCANKFAKIGSYVYFTVEEPFAVTPNRSSRVIFHYDRTEWFVTNCDFENAAFVGTYGTAVDQVWDGNTFNYAPAGPIMNAHNSVVWYWTSKDNSSENVISPSAEDIRHRYAGVAYGNSQANNLGFLGIRYCYNTMGVGGGILALLSTTKLNPFVHMIYENNTINSENTNIVATYVKGMDGFVFKNNLQYTKKGDATTQISAYSPSAQTMFNKYGTNKNEYGYPIILCDEFIGKTRVKGDVNNDGKVSLKDITILRYMLAEKLSKADIENTYGTGTLKNYADMNGDGIVDARDIFALRLFILDPDDWEDKVGMSSAESSAASSTAGSSSASSSSASSSSSDSSATSSSAQSSSSSASSSQAAEEDITAMSGDVIINSENWSMLTSDGNFNWQDGVLKIQTGMDKSAIYKFDFDKANTDQNSKLKKISYSIKFTNNPSNAQPYMLFFGFESLSKYSALKIYDDNGKFRLQTCLDGAWGGTGTFTGIDFTKEIRVDIEYLYDGNSSMKALINISQDATSIKNTYKNTLDPTFIIFSPKYNFTEASDMQIGYIK